MASRYGHVSSLSKKEELESTHITIQIPSGNLEWTFAIGKTICHASSLVDEQGRLIYKLPGIDLYAAWPWLLLNKRTLFNVFTRQRIQHTFPRKYDPFNTWYAIILSPCRACISLQWHTLVTLAKTSVFLYTDVVRNLKCVLGVVPMDALNEVYRFIKR